MAKILLVDDDQSLAQLTKTALVKKGYEVTVARDAIKAIEEAKRQKPDLILMDIMLPQVSGGEAVKELRKDPSLINIPVVFLTALVSSGEEDIEKTGIFVDGIKYKTLGKPYEIDQLLKLIASIIH